MKIRRSEILHLLQDGPYRLERVQSEFLERFGHPPHVIVSAPGRSELIGNHTDHNNGRVVAAAINLDTIVVAAPSQDGVSRLVSLGWDDTFIVDPNAAASTDTHDTQRLIRGIADGLRRAGLPTVPFEAVIDSRVLPGSGLSSSAAIEISLVGIHEALSDTPISPVDRAKVGRFAENEYIGKPSGLMDQMASSIGGCVAIDFADEETPRYHRIDFDFRRTNHQLAIVDTGGSHANLTPQYAAVPQEMLAVAGTLGVGTLSETNRKELFKNAKAVRETVGDRGFLRAVHFFNEQDRVLAFTDAVDARLWDHVLRLMNESGTSSWELLQNVYPTDSYKEQSIALGLAMTNEYFRERGAVGACRVHGGGFAGTMLAVVPLEIFPEYQQVMNRIFGKNATHPLSIRREGLVYASLAQ
jgi:galactokinase